MQNIIIDKKTNKVEYILHWANNEKVEQEDYPDNLIIYIEKEDDYLDTNKNYKYINNKFQEYKEKINNKDSEIADIKKQLLVLQQYLVEKQFQNLKNKGGVK